MHILTRDNQFGYKEGISAIYAIKIEPYIDHSGRDAEILLVDISNAIDTINRMLLWTTLRKKGIPTEMTNRTKQGHRGK